MNPKNKQENVATVIQFPQRPTPGSSGPEANGGEDHPPKLPTHNSNQSPKKHPRSKILMRSTLSIFAIFAVPLFAIWAAGSLQNVPARTGEGSRSLASVSALEMERDESFERKLAHDLQAGQRDIASVRLGQDPSPMDRLRYDILNGEYRVVMAEMKLSEVHATEETQRLVDFKYVLEFFHTQPHLLAIKGAQVLKVSENRSSAGVSEIHEVLNEEGESVAAIDVQLDPYGRLKSLSIR